MPAWRCTQRNTPAKEHRSRRLLTRRMKRMLIATITDDVSSNWFALLALIYGSAVMGIVIVALMKSARNRRAEAQKGR
jgi:hypothetical protein